LGTAIIVVLIHPPLLHFPSEPALYEPTAAVRQSTAATPRSVPATPAAGGPADVRAGARHTGHQPGPRRRVRPFPGRSWYHPPPAPAPGHDPIRPAVPAPCPGAAWNGFHLRNANRRTTCPARCCPTPGPAR